MLDEETMMLLEKLKEEYPNAADEVEALELAIDGEATDEPDMEEDVDLDMEGEGDMPYPDDMDLEEDEDDEEESDLY